MTDQDLADRIIFRLIVSGSAQLRTGNRRTVTKARALLRAAAEEAGLEVTTTKEDDHVRAELVE